MRARLPLTLLALAASACGGPVLFVQVELPQVCLTQQGVVVPGAPSAGAIPPLEVDVPIEQQIPLLTRGAETVIVLDEVSVTPASGSAPDLSGIASAVVGVLPPAGPAVEALRYARDPAQPAPAALVLSGGGVDIAPLLVGGTARLQVAASGKPPSSPWGADLRTCVHGTSKVPYP